MWKRESKTPGANPKVSKKIYIYFSALLAPLLSAYRGKEKNDFKVSANAQCQDGRPGLGASFFSEDEPPRILNNATEGPGTVGDEGWEKDIHLLGKIEYNFADVPGHREVGEGCLSGE